MMKRAKVRAEMKGSCQGHSNEELERMADALRVEYARACQELLKLYPDEDVARVDEVWTTRWNEWYEVLGVGSSRVVVGVCEEHALKVEMNDGEQNANEWAVWQKAEGELREWLCPALSYQFGVNDWLLVVRCQKVVALEEATVLIADRVRGIWDLDTPESGGFEWLLDNWGQLGNSQVMLDYGYSDPAEVGLEPLGIDKESV